MPKNGEKTISRQAQWLKDHGMRSITIHGQTYRKLNRLRQARAKAMRVKLSWNDYILLVTDEVGGAK